MRARNTNRNPSTATGLDMDRSIDEAREVLEQKHQACKESYLRSSLKLKQHQVNCEVKEVQSAKSKLVEFKKEILLHAADADMILSLAKSKVDS